MLNKAKISKILILIVIAATIMALGGCSYRIKADYDRVIDKTAVCLQSKIETFLNKMERCYGTQEGQYSSNIYFYDEMDGTLASLSLRAANIPYHEKVLEQLNLLKDILARLRQAHESEPCCGLTKETIGSIRAELTALFATIYITENNLKRSAKVTTSAK